MKNYWATLNLMIIEQLLTTTTITPTIEDTSDYHYVRGQIFMRAIMIFHLL